ncbi:MAG: hypothetical protein RQM92_16450 [Candidatus Syntrophopropionicum ammoniitolerans]
MPEKSGGDNQALIEKVNPYAGYARHITALVDVPAIEKAGLKVIVDPMHGAGVGYLENLLMHGGLPLLLYIITVILFLVVVCLNPPPNHWGS